MAYFTSKGFEVKLNETTTFLDKTGELQELKAGNEPYQRPSWLYPHQDLIVDLQKRGNCLIKGMRQFTGKTTATHLSNLETLLENPGTRTACMTTSIDHSKELFVRKITEPRLWEVFSPRLATWLKENYTTHNGSSMGIYPMKPSAVQGGTANVVWIDEFDKVVADPNGREALAALLPQLLTTMATGKGRLWVTCNQGITRQFHAIEKVLATLGGAFFPVVSIEEPTTPGGERVFNITNANVPSPDLTSMSRAEREEFLKTFMYQVITALADEQFAKAQILNLEDWTADPFPPELIDAAFQEPTREVARVIQGRQFIRRELANTDEFYKNTIMYVDPGFSHATGILVLGLTFAGEVHQLYAAEFHGGEITEELLKDEIVEVARRFRCRLVLIENNSGGTWWAQHVRDQGLNVQTTGFGTSNPNSGDVTNATKHLERAYYERVLKQLLEDRLLKLASKVLRGEMDFYDPDANKEKGKGDLMDCLLQCAFYVVGGYQYLQDLAARKSGEESEFTSLAV